MAVDQVTITVTLSDGQDHKHTYTAEQYAAWAKGLGVSPIQYLTDAMAGPLLWLNEPIAAYNTAHVQYFRIETAGSAEVEAQLKRETRTIGFQRPGE